MKGAYQLGFLLSLGIFSASCSSRSAQFDDRICSSDIITTSYVHKYGMEVAENEWGNRGKSGKIVSTLKNGVIVTKDYMDGYLEGETTYTFPHSGAVQKVEMYSSGQLIAEKEMYPTGRPKSEVQYEKPHRKVISEWYEDGQPHFREDWHNGKLVEADYFTKNNQVESKIDDGNGIRINRDEFGQILSRDKFDDGEMVLRTLFYPNGSPKEVIPYHQRRVHGQRKTFLPGGEPRTIESWNEDRQEGVSVVFQNGEKIAEVPYSNGMKNGTEVRYKDGRFIVEEINWKNGKKHGPSYTHINDETHMSWYCEGQEITKRQYDRMLSPVPHH